MKQLRHLLAAPTVRNRVNSCIVEAVAPREPRITEMYKNSMSSSRSTNTGRVRGTSRSTDRGAN